jgi:predicted RNA-binding protein with PIN domain
MSLQYIIDGCNVINHPLFLQHSNKKIKNQHLALLDLIKTKKLTGSPKNKVIIVFDGHPNLKDTQEASYLSETAINVIFSRRETADAKIKKIAENLANPKNTITVSDDKEIRLFVRLLRGQTLGVEEFITRRERARPDKGTEIKTELSFTQRERINQELKKLWLK